MDKNPYFISRTQVGRHFATQLEEFRYENTAILALSPGGVVIAIEIAKKLHSLVGLLLLKHVYLPGGQIAIGVINDQGGFTYDQSISAGQIEEFETEYRGNIEDSRREAVHELHMIGHEATFTPHYFSGRTVIIVNDFAKTGTAFHAAMDFLKPVKTDKIIVVSAVAQPKAVDVMHQIGDKILIEHTTDKDFPDDHYFANNEIPQSEELVKIMEQIVLQW